jgi:D-hydroxyproline dehydrogenase
MLTRERTEIAVIGAGVIGLTIALELVEAGHEVMLVDPADPGMGASYGNAGTIATYAVSPVGTPQVLRSLPSLMFSRTSPLAIRHRALPSLTPGFCASCGSLCPPRQTGTHRRSLPFCKTRASGGMPLR